MKAKEKKMSKGQWHGGKGSIARKVDIEKYENNYDRIFSKKDTDEDKDNDTDKKDTEETNNNETTDTDESNNNENN